MKRRNKKIKIILHTAIFIASTYLRLRRKYWVHPINMQRDSFGEYKTLCLELEKYPDKYYSYFRMSQLRFNELLQMIKIRIEAKPNNYRTPIDIKLKLVLTLRLVKIICYRIQ